LNNADCFVLLMMASVSNSVGNGCLTSVRSMENLYANHRWCWFAIVYNMFLNEVL
jgi:hypothetical protein